MSTRHKHASAIVFVMNRWHSEAGGIQTVNRELLCSIARRFPRILCACLVTASDDRERETARKSSVHLISGDEPDDWLSPVLSSEITKLGCPVLAIVGHGRISGRPAQLIRERFFPRAQLVHFVHDNPLTTESSKEYRQGSFVASREMRQRTELDLAARATVVAAIGPQLHRYMSDQLTPIDWKGSLLRIDCGIADRGEARSAPAQPTVLFLGRTQSIGVKGLDLFAKAAGEIAKSWNAGTQLLKLPTPHFIVRGGPPGECERIERELREVARAQCTDAVIFVKQYTTETTELEADLRSASVLVMPSRSEAFGLVACEALSFCVPVVVSASSGIGELLREVGGSKFFDLRKSIVDLRDESSAPACLASAVVDVLTRVDSFKHAEALRTHLLGIASWDAAADAFVERLDTLGMLHRPAGLPDGAQEHASIREIDVLRSAVRLTQTDSSGFGMLALAQVIWSGRAHEPFHTEAQALAAHIISRTGLDRAGRPVLLQARSRALACLGELRGTSMAQGFREVIDVVRGLRPSRGSCQGLATWFRALQDSRSTHGPELRELTTLGTRCVDGLPESMRAVVLAEAVDPIQSLGLQEWATTQSAALIDRAAELPLIAIEHASSVLMRFAPECMPGKVTAIRQAILLRAREVDEFTVGLLRLADAASDSSIGASVAPILEDGGYHYAAELSLLGHIGYTVTRDACRDGSSIVQRALDRVWSDNGLAELERMRIITRLILAMEGHRDGASTSTDFGRLSAVVDRAGPTSHYVYNEIVGAVADAIGSAGHRSGLGILTRIAETAISRMIESASLPGVGASVFIFESLARTVVAAARLAPDDRETTEIRKGVAALAREYWSHGFRSFFAAQALVSCASSCSLSGDMESAMELIEHTLGRCANAAIIDVADILSETLRMTARFDEERRLRVASRVLDVGRTVFARTSPSSDGRDWFLTEVTKDLDNAIGVPQV